MSVGGGGGVMCDLRFCHYFPRGMATLPALNMIGMDQSFLLLEQIVHSWDFAWWHSLWDMLPFQLLEL